MIDSVLSIYNVPDDPACITSEQSEFPPVFNSENGFIDFKMPGLKFKKSNDRLERGIPITTKT